MNVESDPPHDPQAAEVIPASAYEVRPRPKPWGFWMTLGLTLLILLIFMATQTVVVVAHLFTTEVEPGVSFQQRADKASENGMVLAVSSICGAFVIPFACVFFAWLKGGITIRDYLALRAVSGKQLAGWLSVSIGMAAGLDLATYLLGQPIVPDVMIRFYDTVSFKPLLWLGVVLAAPLTEEFLFRGFTFAGLRETWLGTSGTVGGTAIAWAGLHIQYNFMGIASIVVAGLVLGYARVRSNSLFVPIAMHALHNLVAMLELAYVVHNKQVVAASEWPNYFASFC